MPETAPVQHNDRRHHPLATRWRRHARAIAFAAAWLAADAVASEEVEVLHYWQPDEHGTLLLKDMLRKQGHTWRDFVIVPGGTNGLLNSLLASRVQTGNPPFAALVRAPVARQWGRKQRLSNLDEVARAEQWDRALPKAIREAVKDQDSYIAVPVSIYQENGLWLNNRLLRRVGAKAPHDWPSFFEAADKLRRAGIVAVAHGGQQRGNLNLFSNVALGVGGPAFYRRAFVQHDSAALSGETMEQVLLTFRRIKRYTQADVGQRDWPAVAGDLIHETAAMVFMGGWSAPLFTAANAQSGFDYSCIPTPGSDGAFVYLIDSFSMFRLRSGEQSAAQKKFASGLLAPTMQSRFNLGRGSIPARADPDLTGFDACTRESAAAFRRAERADTLVPSFALVMTAPVEVNMAEAVSAFWVDDSMTPKTAMQLLAAALK